MRAAVQAKLGEDTEVTISGLAKNNRQYVDSMCLLPRGANISPAIYMEQYYEQYQKGCSIEELAAASRLRTVYAGAGGRWTFLFLQILKKRGIRLYAS